MPAVHTERPADLTVFFSSDTRGMLRRCGCSEGQLGGLSARADYIKFNRVDGRTLVLDAGDTLFDGLDAPPVKRDFYLLKARTMLSAMGQSGYDAALVGEYDLAYGLDFLTEAGRESGFRFLAKNITAEKDGKTYSPFKAGIVKKFKGFSVGVIGVVDSGFPYKDFPGNFGGLAVSDTAASAGEGVKDMQGKADVVIVLAHMSVKPVERFANAVPGADIIIQGHSQEELDKPIKVGDTYIVKGFNKGKRIGRLDIWLGGEKGRGARGRKVQDLKYSIITLDESIPPDPGVEGIISGYREELKRRKFTLMTPGPLLSGFYTGPGKCRECHDTDYKNWSETAHARAYGSLVKTGDQYDPECLSCHTTGYGYPTGYDNRDETARQRNVTCESCHGRGGGHASRTRPMPFSAVTTPMRRAVGEDVCRGCHDDYNSPRFEYEQYKARGGAHRGGNPSPPSPLPVGEGR